MFQKILSALIPLTVLALLFSEVVSTTFYSPGELADARQISVDMAEQGDFDGAIARFEALANIAPNDQQVWADYIAVLLRAGEDSRAWVLADQELNLNTAPAFVIDELLHSSLAVGDNKRAALYSLAGYQRSPDPVEYALVKSRVLADHVLYQEAGDLLESQLQLTPQNPYLLLAQLTLQMQATPEVDNREQLRSLLAAYPDTMAIQYALAQSSAIQAGFGRHQSALVDLDDLYQRNRGDVAIGGDLLVVLSWNEQYRRAVSIYDELGDVELAPYIQLAAAESLARDNRFGDAESIYQHLLGMVNDESTPLANDQRLSRETIDRGLASLEIQRQNYPEAIAILQHYERIPEVSPDTLEVLGEAYQNDERWNKAAQIFTMLMELREDDSKPYLRWFDNTEKAVVRYGIAAYLPSLRQWLPRSSFDALNARMVSLLVKFNQLDLAKSLAAEDTDQRRLVQEFEWQASNARNAGKYNESIRLYRFANDNFAASHEIKLGLALAYSEAGEESAASQLFSQQLGNVDDLGVLSAALYHYRRYGDDRAAKLTLEKLLVSSPDKLALLEFWVDVAQSDQLFETPSDRLQVWQEIAPYYPDSERWWQVSALLLANSGHCQKALVALDAIDPVVAKEEVLESAAFVARQCKDFSRSLRYSLAGVERFGGMNWLALSALVLTDSGEPDKAVSLLNEHRAIAGTTADVLFARAYAYEAQGENDLALAGYKDVMALDSAYQQAYVHHVMLVNAGGDSTEALDLAEQHPEWFQPDHWRKLYADDVAYTLRVASEWPENSPERAQLLLQSDTRLQAFETFLQAEFADNKSYRLNAQFDRIFMLQLRADHRGLLNHFDSLGVATVDAPAYIRVKLAEAHLQLGETAQGITILETVLHDSPDNQAAQSMLFYTYLDSDRFDLAAALIARLVAAIETEDDTKLDRAPWSLQMSAMLAAYTNDLATAADQLQTLAARYPDDSDVLLKQALVDRWRGLPTKALQKYQHLLSNHVDHLESRVGEVDALMAQREYASVGEKLLALEHDHLDHPEVNRLKRNWAIHNRYELDSRVQYGRGENSVLSNSDLMLDTRLFSKPYRHNYRVYGRHIDSWANLPGDEGRGRMHRVGAGLEQRSRQLNWQAEVSQSVIDDGNLGVSLAGSFMPNDNWTFAGDVQTYSLATPLRAINDGIDGKSASASAVYRWHESRSAKMNYSVLDLSDGNRRQAMSAAYTHSIYADSVHQWSLTESVYLSQNSKDDNRLYFNPQQDSSLSLTGHYYGVLSRSASRRWTHRLSMGVGLYRQKKYSSKSIWDVDYEQKWSLDNDLNVSYGVLYKHRSYDGAGENYRAIYGAVNWRF